MSVKKRGLGRGLNDLGLDELLSDFGHDASSSGHQLMNVSVDCLQPGKYQPREDMNYEALQDLSNSIAEQGVIQPLLVRQVSASEPGQYEILAGERRWRASKMAGLLEVPVVVKQVGDETAMLVSLIENIQRENLNVMEEARALDRLLTEFGLTHDQIAQSVGRSRTSVTNLLRLLSLGKELQTMVEHGDLDMGHARALLGLDADKQMTAAKEVISKGLSVRDTEQLVRKMQHEDCPVPKTFKPQADPDLIRLQEHLSQRMVAKVKISHNNQGRGKIVLHYKDLDDLDRLLQKIDR
jgi:ParB family transcriptional regulator, chromosome partitioning protein